MQLKIYNKPLYKELLNIFLKANNVEKITALKIQNIFHKFSHKLYTLKLKKKKIITQWKIFDEIEFYLALRLICNTEFKICPSNEFTDDELTDILFINEITYNSMDTSAFKVYINKNTIIHDQNQSILFIYNMRTLKKKLKHLMPLQRKNIDEKITNYDMRVDEILESYNCKDKTNQFSIIKLEHNKLASNVLEYNNITVSDCKVDTKSLNKKHIQLYTGYKYETSSELF